jgi:hypothetical protein
MFVVLLLIKFLGKIDARLVSLDLLEVGVLSLSTQTMGLGPETIFFPFSRRCCQSDRFLVSRKGCSARISLRNLASGDVSGSSMGRASILSFRICVSAVHINFIAYFGNETSLILGMKRAPEIHTCQQTDTRLRSTGKLQLRR